MQEDVKQPEIVEPAQQEPVSGLSDKARENFARLERAKEEAAERAHKAEIEAALLKQRLEDIEARLKPKEQEIDPLDAVEDFIDPKSLRATLDHREKRLKREAEEIAERKLQEWKAKEHQQNHLQRLKSEYPDFSEVMTEKNIVAVEESNPEFVQSLLHIKDDYERKKLAYNYFKRVLSKQETQQVTQTSIKDRVEENQRNPYYIPAGSGTPAAVDYDLKSPQARQAAYAKLKAAQRRPLGSGSGNPQ